MEIKADVHECSRILNGAIGVSALHHLTQLKNWFSFGISRFKNPLRPDTQDVIASASALRIQVKMITCGYVSIPKETCRVIERSFGSLRCTNSTGLPGSLMQLLRFCLAAFNGGVCGAAAAVGFIIRRPQTSLAAATDVPRHTHWTSSVLIWIVGEGVSECWCRAGV